MSNQSTNPSEGAIIRAAQAGGTETFSQLIELYDRRLLYFVLRLLGDEAWALRPSRQKYVLQKGELVELRGA